MLVHGGGGNGRLLSPFGALLAGLGYEVIAPDLPGYGLTQVRNKRALVYDDWRDTLARVLEAEAGRSRRPLVLFGASMGGTASLVAAGQGTLGLEILEDVPGVTHVYVSIGGGGLITGVATALKAIKPEVRVLGVETHGADAMAQSLAAGRLVVVALFGLLVTFTTRPSEIRAAVEWLLRPIPFIPHRQAATMIGLLVRFIPVILSQSAEQQEALRARSIESCKNPLRRITALCMPLLRRTFVTADRLASAMEARCYGTERTIPCRPVTAAEWSALMAVAGFCALMLGIS